VSPAPPAEPACWGGRPIARRIADAAPRQRLVVRATVASVCMGRWRGSPACTVELDDGTGRLRAVFSRARPVPGMAVGTCCAVEGTVHVDGDGLALWNPAYSFER